jgi:hypothetical protein
MDRKKIKKVTDQYDALIGEGFPISPVAKSEVEIIKELREIFKKVNFHNIVSILDGYKDKADEEISNDLLEFNTNFESNVNENEEEPQEGRGTSGGNIFTRVFIRILGGLYELSYIYSVDRENKYENEDNCYVYYIILNEIEDTGNRSLFYANKRFKFYNEEERDDVYNRIDRNISSERNIKII